MESLLNFSWWEAKSSQQNSTWEGQQWQPGEGDGGGPSPQGRELGQLGTFLPSPALELGTVRPADNTTGLQWDSCRHQQATPEMPAVIRNFISNAFPSIHGWPEALLLWHFSGGCPRLGRGRPGRPEASFHRPWTGPLGAEWKDSPQKPAASCPMGFWCFRPLESRIMGDIARQEFSRYSTLKNIFLLFLLIIASYPSLCSG